MTKIQNSKPAHYLEGRKKNLKDIFIDADAFAKNPDILKSHSGESRHEVALQRHPVISNKCWIPDQSLYRI